MADVGNSLTKAFDYVWDRSSAAWRGSATPNTSGSRCWAAGRCAGARTAAAVEVQAGGGLASSAWAVV
jgi:hypothetical protein